MKRCAADPAAGFHVGLIQTAVFRGYEPASRKAPTDRRMRDWLPDAYDLRTLRFESPAKLRKQRTVSAACNQLNSILFRTEALRSACARCLRTPPSKSAHGSRVGSSRTENPAASAASASRRSPQMKLRFDGRCWHQTKEAASCKLSAERKEYLSNDSIAKSRS